MRGEATVRYLITSILTRMRIVVEGSGIDRAAETAFPGAPIDAPDVCSDRTDKGTPRFPPPVGGNGAKWRQASLGRKRAKRIRLCANTAE